VTSDPALGAQPVGQYQRDGALTQGPPAVGISHLRKTYGTTVALDDLSLSVTAGEIFGVLGPNGAGKTTAVECAIGLRRPDSGSIQVMGLDPVEDREQLRLVVGVQLQSSRLPAKLTVGEIVDLYRSFYREPVDVDELIETLGLADKRDHYYRSLSGGQQRRLALVLALIGRPKLAVLDEMTTGLDPQARRDAWDLIDTVRQRGVTVVLVTHFMEEAERLCDRVALIDRGRVVALDTPRALARRVAGPKLVRFEASAPFDDDLLSRLSEVTAVEHHGLRMQVSGTGDLVNAVILTLAAAGVTAHDVELDTTSLEDAFVAYSGHHLSPASPARAHREPDRTTRRAASPGSSRLPIFSKTAPPSAFTKLVGSEARLAWRWPIGLIFGLGLPILLLLIFGLLPAFHQHRPKLGGLSYFDVYVPTLVALVVAALAFFSVPTPLATYREHGILRQLSTTPLPPSWVLGAQLVVQLAIAAIALMILMVVGTVGFGLETPTSIAGFTLAAALTITAVFALGLWVAGTARSAAFAGGIAWAVFFPLMFFAGLWVPVQEFPSALRDVGNYTPLGASVEALQHAINNGFPTGSSLPVLAGYSVIFGWLALRYFRWE
jgi:ABC-2 type transport system ATP-binding protein